MKNVLVVMLMILTVTVSSSQSRKNKKEITIPMEPSSWNHQPEQVEFITHRSVPAVRGKDGGVYQIFLKDIEFRNGTIEYDVELTGMGFPGIYFRMSEDSLSGEHFYLRSFGPTSPLNRSTLQYTAIVNGGSNWDLTDDYQAGATIYQEGWNHVKLVVSGKQMKVYVNDMDKVAMHVPNLEGRSSSGSISLSGNVIYANLVIKHDVVEGLNDDGGYDPTQNDPHYLRNWLVTESVGFPFGREVIRKYPPYYGDAITSDLPDNTTLWKPVRAGHRALINLSNQIGVGPLGERKLAWLKTTITSDAAQIRRIDLGFSDEVWVFINGKLLHIDKNLFGTPSAKEPKGRCTIENSSFDLPLLKGDNEILIGLANSFYGGGIIARLDQTTGLDFK